MLPQCIFPCPASRGGQQGNLHTHSVWLVSHQPALPGSGMQLSEELNIKYFFELLFFLFTPTENKTLKPKLLLFCAPLDLMEDFDHTPDTAWKDACWCLYASFSGWRCYWFLLAGVKAGSGCCFRKPNVTWCLVIKDDCCVGHLYWDCLFLPSEDIVVEYVFYFDHPWTSSEIVKLTDGCFIKKLFFKNPQVGS